VCDHISSTLQDLHWLPVRYRVQYKLCILMYTIHHGLSPACLSERVNSQYCSRTDRTAFCQHHELFITSTIYLQGSESMVSHTLDRQHGTLWHIWTQSCTNLEHFQIQTEVTLLKNCFQSVALVLLTVHRWPCF